MRRILTLIWVAFIAYAWFWVPGKPLGSDPGFKELLTVRTIHQMNRKICKI